MTDSMGGVIFPGSEGRRKLALMSESTGKYFSSAKSRPAACCTDALTNSRLPCGHSKSKRCARGVERRGQLERLQDGGWAEAAASLVAADEQQRGRPHSGAEPDVLLAAVVRHEQLVHAELDAARACGLNAAMGSAGRRSDGVRAC